MHGLSPKSFHCKCWKCSMSWCLMFLWAILVAEPGRCLAGMNSCCNQDAQDPHLSPRKQTNGAGWHKAWPSTTCPLFIPCRGCSPPGSCDLVQLLYSAAPLKGFCNQVTHKSSGFDVMNQRTAEKDKIIPVSSKRSVPKEQLQVHRSLAASQPL